MKWNKIFIVAALLFAAIGCSQDIVDEEMDPVMLKTLTIDPSGDYDVVFDVVNLEICGEITQLPFETSGIVTIKNDADFLYVEVNPIDDWTVRFLSVFVGDPADLPMRDDGIRVDPFAFPYLNYFSPAQSYVLYKIPIDETWGNCFSIVVKVITKKVDTLGNELTEYDFVYFDDSYIVDYCLNFCCEPYGYRTQTPGGWGSKARGNNPGAYRDAHFDDAFPSGLIAGGLYTITLETSADVQDYLPAGGTPAALTTNYINPSSKALKNSFAMHVVALTLSVGFDNNDPDFGLSSGALSDLVLTDGSGFGGMTIGEILADAHKVLGGEASDYGYSLLQLHGLLDKINNSFVDGAWEPKYDIFTCE